MDNNTPESIDRFSITLAEEILTESDETVKSVIVQKLDQLITTQQKLTEYLCASFKTSIEEINYTELLEQEYGQDEIAVSLIKDFREDLHQTDKEIYQFLESFY